MANLRQRETRNVPLSWLPSKGKDYPETLEIAVAPLTIKERKILEGSSASEYYRKLLEGVMVSGATFRPKDILFCDMQFIDLVRRIFTFEIDKKIKVTEYPCPHCRKRNVEVEFMISDIEFEDLKEGLFGSEKTMIDKETGEEVKTRTIGKSYKFSDDTEVIVRPITTGEFIDMAARYISNIGIDGHFDSAEMTDAYIGSFTYLIKDVSGGEFKDDKQKREFIFDYISELYKDKDQQVLDDIQEDVATDVKPIYTRCPDCGKEVEVYVQPSLTFRQ